MWLAAMPGPVYDGGELWPVCYELVNGAADVALRAIVHHLAWIAVGAGADDSGYCHGGVGGIGSSEATCA